MSEDEKKAIENFRREAVGQEYMRTIINLIDKQNKEINRLQEENNELKEQLTYTVNTNNKDILENWRKK